MKSAAMVLISFLTLFLTGCASTCDFEDTLVFMNKNDFQEICMIMNDPPELAGQEYCVRKKPGPSLVSRQPAAAKSTP